MTPDATAILNEYSTKAKYDEVCRLLAEEVAKLREANVRAAEVIARLKAGQFTADEIHEICHNLHGTVSAQAFADGCAAEQRKLYGYAPDRDGYDLRMRGFSAAVTECHALLDHCGIPSAAHVACSDADCQLGHRLRALLMREGLLFGHG